MTGEETAPSARQAELLELAYRYVASRGRAELSLRPLASAIGSSPRVLLYLFGSKDGLIRALLARARADELAVLGTAGGDNKTAPDGLGVVAARIWSWLAAGAHRGLLTLWIDSYARSLAAPAGPWADFAATTVADWLTVLGAAQEVSLRDTAAGLTERTLVLAVLRGALLDLLATGDVERTTASVCLQLTMLVPPDPPG